MGGILKDTQVEIQAQIHCEDGMYWAEVASHPGLFASGETLDELKEALVEAWFLYTQEVASTHIEATAPQATPTAEKPANHSGRVDQLKLLVPA
ncbi:MAG: type II toxin-antitoxin system HicB family antitoxin [Solirubrobacteraceae bacterium]